MRLIDADALDYLCFKIIEDDHNQGAAPTSWAQAYSAFQDDIDNAPTIEAEPVRRGKWLVTPYTDYDDTYECSACGHGWVFVEGTPKENDANYCPNCGAKMEV